MKLNNLTINKENFKNNGFSLNKRIMAGAIAIGLVAGGIGFNQLNEINKEQAMDDMTNKSYEELNYDELSNITFNFENTDALDEEGLFLTVFNTDGELLIYVDADNQGYVSDEECFLIPGEDTVVGITYNGKYQEYEIEEVQDDTEYHLNLDCDSGELTVDSVSTNKKTM